MQQHSEPSKGEKSWDRRRHVRVRPAADYDVIVEVSEGPVFTRCQVVDLSLGGIGLLMEPPVDSFEPGTSFELRVTTPEAAPLRVTALVKHRARGVCGAEFRESSDEFSAALRRAVSELLERGNQA